MQNSAPHDPGGRSIFPLKPGVAGSAFISPDGRHRLWLSRIWGPSGRYIAIVGLNPSVASPDFDDPTIVRDCGFAQRWGYDGLFKLNLSTYRATDPKKLLLITTELRHPDAQHVMRRIAGRCSQVVLAYGAVHLRLQPLVDIALTDLRAVKSELWCLGTTKAGHPKHTLYLRSDTPLQKFWSADPS